MELLLYIIAKLVDLTLGAVSAAMLLRVIIPLVTDAENNRLYAFCTVISEPFVIPFRYILVKLNVGQDSPIDMSFTLAYFAIALLRMFLPVI